MRIDRIPLYRRKLTEEIMFQTIGHKGGFVQISTLGNVSRIEAWSHGEKLGEYRTIAGAKGAVTRAHKQWLAMRNADHYIHALSKTDGGN